VRREEPNVADYAKNGEDIQEQKIFPLFDLRIFVIYDKVDKD